MRVLKVFYILFLASYFTVAVAQIVPNIPFNLQNGQTADASQVMADFNAVLNGVNNGAAKNGVNQDITALAGLITPLTQAQGGSAVFFGGTAIGVSNSYTINVTTPTGYMASAGVSVLFKPSVGNTSAVTLSVNSSTAVAVVKQTAAGLTPLTGGEFIIGQAVLVYYDGTQYQFLNSSQTQLGAQVSLASASTTDLGTSQTNDVLITGSTTINSFGSSAGVASPFYIVSFSAGTTLVSSSNLVLPAGQNLVTGAGDSLLALYLGAGKWQVIFSNAYPNNLSVNGVLYTGGSNAGSVPAIYRNAGSVVGSAASTVVMNNTVGTKATVLGGGGALTLQGALNVASVNRFSAGVYTINFANSYPNTNYQINLTTSWNPSVYPYFITCVWNGKSTSSVSIVCGLSGSNSPIDFTNLDFTITGGYN